MWLDRLWRDLRHGWRVFAKAPGFTAIAVLSIACGTGANVAMFSTTDAILLRPLPVDRPYQLITVGMPLRLGPFAGTRMSYPDYLDVRDQSRTFSSLLAFTTFRAAFSTGRSVAPQVRLITAVSGNFFEDLGIAFLHGRGIRADEDRVPGRDAVVVLSHGMWKALLGGDPAPIGRDVMIAGRHFTVVGVTAETFTGMYTRTIRETAYVPLVASRDITDTPGIDPLTDRSYRTLEVRGYLRPEVTLRAARAELKGIAANLQRDYPDSNAGQEIAAITELQSRLSGSALEAGLVVVLNILAIAVLCVACANVAGLLTSRAPLRARELAVRLAIGAGRGRLVMQLLTESLVVALLGGALGVAVGYAGIVLIRQIEIPSDIISPPVLLLDQRALMFSLAMALGSAVVFGLGPALSTTRMDLSNAIRGTEPAARQRWRPAGRSSLIALQVALSLTLLTIATFAYQTFRSSFGEGPGFRTTRMAKLNIDASQAGYRGQRAAEFFDRVVADVQRLPGVASASVTSAMPLMNLDLVVIVPDGAAVESENRVTTFGNSVDERYFETMEIPLVSGRAFSVRDTADAPMVAVINDTMAAHYWPGKEPLDQRFRLNDQDGPWVQIVGVVRTSMYLYPGEAPQDMVYFPFRQQPRSDMTLLVQTRGPSAQPLPAMHEIVHAADPAVPVFDGLTIERLYAALATGLADVIMTMITGIGVMGMAITLVGLYGLVSYAVNRRTREIGIRIAIGATYGRVLRMVLRQGLTPAWVGMVFGTGLSVAVGTLLPAFVPSNNAHDVRAIFLVVPVLIVVTLGAAFIPSRRAARVDPMVALRQE